MSSRPGRPISASIEALETRCLRAVDTVTTLDYFANGGLHQAVQYSAAGDTIDLRQVTGTINNGYSLYITHDLTIIGPGADKLTFDSTGQRGFLVSPGVHLTLVGFAVINGGGAGYDGGVVWVDGSVDNEDAPAKLALTDMTLSNNLADNGGAIYAADCDVTLTDCLLTGNTARGTDDQYGVGSDDAFGGAVYLSGGTFTASGCTFDHNAATASGGPDRQFLGPTDGGAFGGALALMQVGDSAITNCTVADNTVEATPNAAAGSTTVAMGAGVLLAGLGNFTMTNCTVAGNVTSDAHGAASFGGGFAVLGFVDATGANANTLAVRNSILAGNTAATGSDAFGLDVSDSGKTAFTNNVLGVTTDSGITAGKNGNVGGTIASPLDAGLDALADNGGSTPTMMLETDSPAIHRATSYLPKKDQRGHARGAVSAAGAYTTGDYTPAPPVTVVPPSFDTVPAAAAATDRFYGSTVKASTTSAHFTAVNKPDWLTVTDNGNGTAALTGTPTWADAGEASVTLKLTAGSLTQTETFAVAVAATPALVTGGILRVNGTDGDDAIHVWQPRGSGGAVRVTIGRRMRNYAVAGITAIEVYGRDGDDAITVNCADLGAYVNGGIGNDTIVGGAQDDTLSGAAGNDAVYGMGGSDLLRGGAGRDRLDGGDGDDRLLGDAGNDVLIGGAGSDVCYGGLGTDAFLSDDGQRDRLFGDASDVYTGDRRDIRHAEVSSE